MKPKFLFYLFFYFLIISCSKSNSNQEDKKEEKILTGELIGKWQIAQECYYDFNTPRQCQEVEEKRVFYFQFKNDGIVITDRHDQNCNNGTYTLEENNQIYLLFNCTDFLFSIEEKTTTTLELNSRADDGGLISIFKRVE